MLIQIALRETEKAVNENNPLDGKTGYVRWNADELWWYDRLTKNARRELTHQEIFDNYKPYHEAKEIRPEKAGELWINKDGRCAHTSDGAGCVWLSKDANQPMRLPANFLDIIHNKKGWKLLYSPDKEVMDRIKEVEDESVERIEIKNVTWHKGVCNGVAVIFPRADNGKDTEEVGPGLLTRPPMTMILEIPKEKP